MHWRDISEDERAGLKAEAEARMRAGQTLNEIARALSVGVSTLARWASDGGWRKQDLALERDADRAQARQARQAAQMDAVEGDKAADWALRRPALAKAAPLMVDRRALAQLKPAEAVRAALALAARAQLDGELDLAERHARLGERLARLCRIAPAIDADASEYKSEEELVASILAGLGLGVS